MLGSLRDFGKVNIINYFDGGEKRVLFKSVIRRLTLVVDDSSVHVALNFGDFFGDVAVSFAERGTDDWGVMQSDFDFGKDLLVYGGEFGAQFELF